MHHRIIHIALTFIGFSAVVLPLRGENNDAAPRPTYKNPLDVSVDQEGKFARVVLMGTGMIAEVDLLEGKVVKETPWPDNRPFPKLDAIPVHQATESQYLHIPRQARAALVFAERKPSAANAGGEAPVVRRVLSIFRNPKVHLPATQVAQGWVFTNHIAMSPAWTFGDFGYDGGIARNNALLDDPARACADLSDLAMHNIESPSSTDGRGSEIRQGKHLFIASAGDDRVLAVDFQALNRYLRRNPGKPALDAHSSLPAYDWVEDLTASRNFLTAKLPTEANPRRLGLSGDGQTLVVSNYLADSLTVIDAVHPKVVKTIPLGGPQPDAARRGEILFHSAKITFQGQFSCASCHPNGHTDNLNWDLTRDGIGNFKNTKSLLGVKDSAPYGWLGSSASLEDRIRGTLRTLHRYAPSDAEVEAMAAYLATLPPPEPDPIPEQAKTAVARGKALFAGKAGCIVCHSGPAYDDGKLHNVGTGIDDESRFNTPSLRGLARTAPYLHDGRAKTLEEIFEKHNPEQRHGQAHELSTPEMADLLMFLQSL